MFSKTRSSVLAASLLRIFGCCHHFGMDSPSPTFWIGADGPEVPRGSCGQSEPTAASSRSSTSSGCIYSSSTSSTDATFTLGQKKEIEWFNSNVKSILQHGSTKAQVLMVMTRIIKMHKNREATEQVCFFFYYNWQFTKKQIVVNETTPMGKTGRSWLYSSLRLKPNQFG